jgi:hypothetical protein
MYRSRPSQPEAAMAESARSVVYKKRSNSLTLGTLAHFSSLHLGVIKQTLPFREESVPGPPSGL